MNFLAVLLLSLFTSVKSSNATQDGTFHKNTRTNGIALLNSVSKNDTNHESQLTRHRRSVHTSNTDNCYRQFFVGKQPPVGFTSSTGDPNDLRYICQGHCQDALLSWTSCFSTLFDLNYKIPIFSAYVVRPLQARLFGTAKRVGMNFRKEPGIPADKQGSGKMYSQTNDLLKPQKIKIHKGHLVPAAIYSFSPDHMRSTFTYTNAVPQYGTFNCGQWAKHEKLIKAFAKKKCSKKNGDLYLLTGISDIRVKLQGNSISHTLQVLNKMPEEPNIVIPNSMWTAGCCVSGQEVLGSFAVIGNNDLGVAKNKDIFQLPVSELESKIGQIGLFPGNVNCKDKNYHVTI